MAFTHSFPFFQGQKRVVKNPVCDIYPSSSQLPPHLPTKFEKEKSCFEISFHSGMFFMICEDGMIKENVAETTQKTLLQLKRNEFYTFLLKKT